MARAYDSTVFPRPAEAIWEIIPDHSAARSTAGFPVKPRPLTDRDRVFAAIAPIFGDSAII